MDKLVRKYEDEFLHLNADLAAGAVGGEVVNVDVVEAMVRRGGELIAAIEKSDNVDKKGLTTRVTRVVRLCQKFLSELNGSDNVATEKEAPEEEVTEKEAPEEKPECPDIEADVENMMKKIDIKKIIEEAMENVDFSTDAGDEKVDEADIPVVEKAYTAPASSSDDLCGSTCMLVGRITLAGLLAAGGYLLYKKYSGGTVVVE